MKGIEHLRSIHHMMDKNERLVLRNYLTAFESRKKGHKPKTLILLDLLEKYTDDEKVVTLLKKKVLQEDARRMVVSRLRDKMLASLTLDVNLSREETYDEQARAMASVVKGKLQGRLLIARGRRDIGFQVLDRYIQLAKQFELYDDLVDMLGVERQFIKAWKGSDEAFYSVDNEIQNYALCRDAVNLAKKYYEEITMRYGFKGLNRTNPDHEQLQYLKTRSEELHAVFEQTSSATVGYYFYYVLIEYCQVQNKLNEASQHLNSLAQMVENNPSINRRVRLATVYGNLGANELWMHRFSEAESYLKRSLEFLRPDTRNYALIVEYVFYTQFYSGNLVAANNSLESLVASKYVDQSEFRKAVRNYLLACVAFGLGQFKQVNRYLSESQGIGKDKEGWNFGSRVLTIMLALEQEKFDYADSLIVNLRQFVREGLKGIEMRKRDILILDMLVELRKNSYNFNDAKDAKPAILKSLFKDDIETGWVVQTPEMICFHTWFSDKLNERAYQINYTKEHLFRS